MIIIKKSNHFITLLLVALIINSNNTNAMEESTEKMGWVTLAGAAIIGGYTAYRQFLSYIHSKPEVQSGTPSGIPFMLLPQEIQQEIIGLLAIISSAKTIKGNSATAIAEATESIRALAVTNTSLNKLINDPQFCLKIIKHFAQKFDCSDEMVAETLATQGAKERLQFQRKVIDIVNKDSTNEIIFKQFYQQNKNYIDLNFTYLYPSYSGYDCKYKELFIIVLLSALSNSHKTRIQWILNTHDIDINMVVGGRGDTILHKIIKMPNITEELLISVCQYPNVNINKKNGWGETAFTECCERCSKPGAIRQGEIGLSPFKIIEILLKYGADPESAIPFYSTLRGTTFQTPLEYAQEHNCTEIIPLLQDAIKKKHERK